MDTVKIFSLDRNRKAEGKSDRGNEIIEDIRNICKMLDSAYERFQ